MNKREVYRCGRCFTVFRLLSLKTIPRHYHNSGRTGLRSDAVLCSWSGREIESLNSETGTIEAVKPLLADDLPRAASRRR